MGEAVPEPAVCDRCGQDALGVLGDEHLCETCVHEASGCCGE